MFSSELTTAPLRTFTRASEKITLMPDASGLAPAAAEYESAVTRLFARVTLASSVTSSPAFTRALLPRFTWVCCRSADEPTAQCMSVSESAYRPPLDALPRTLPSKRASAVKVTLRAACTVAPSSRPVVVVWFRSAPPPTDEKSNAPPPLELPSTVPFWVLIDCMSTDPPAVSRAAVPACACTVWVVFTFTSVWPTAMKAPLTLPPVAAALAAEKASSVMLPPAVTWLLSPTRALACVLTLAVAADPPMPRNSDPTEPEACAPDTPLPSAEPTSCRAPPAPSSRWPLPEPALVMSSSSWCWPVTPAPDSSMPSVPMVCLPPPAPMSMAAPPAVADSWNTSASMRLT